MEHGPVPTWTGKIGGTIGFGRLAQIWLYVWFGLSLLWLVNTIHMGPKKGQIHHAYIITYSLTKQCDLTRETRCYETVYLIMAC